MEACVIGGPENVGKSVTHILGVKVNNVEDAVGFTIAMVSFILYIFSD